MTPLTQVLAACALSAVIVVGAVAERPQGGTVGSFVAFVTAMLMLVAPIKHLSEVAGPITRGMAALERGVALIDDSPAEAGGSFDPGRARGELELRDVTLRYRDATSAGARTDVEPAPARRRSGGAGRPVGRRQVDAGQPAAALHRTHRRATAARRHAAVATGTCTRCAASSRSSARTWCCSTTAWPPTWRWATRPTASAVRDGAARAPTCSTSSTACRRASTRAIGHNGERALGRPAPAPGDRPRDLQGRADPDPRRGHLGARLRIRAAGAGGAGER